MSNYTPTGAPSSNAAGDSATIRAEFSAIATAITSKVDTGGDLGTPSAGVATNLTGTAAGLTAGAVAVGGVTGLGTGVATFLATPSSANLRGALTDETGTGAAVFGTGPTLKNVSIEGANFDTALVITNTSTGDVMLVLSLTALGPVLSLLGPAGAGRFIVTATGVPHSVAAEAPPAGGSNAVAGLLMSSSSLGLYFGSGAPTLTAAKGSLYLRTDGSATNNRMYINTDGGTTWTAVTTAS